MFENLLKKTGILVFCLLVLAVFIGGCEEENASAKKLFDYRQIELDNGMKVISLEDFSTPIVSVQIWYKVGSKDENPKRRGFAHMFEHMMFKGTDLVSEKDHFDSIHKVGGTNNAYTSFDKTVYTQTVPVDKLEMVLWLEAERMTFLTVDQEAFDTERKIVEEEMRMGANRPYGTAFEKMLKELFKVHPYQWSVIGEQEDLRASTVAELRAFWQKYYVPNNAALVVVGAVKHEDVQKLAEKYFGWVPRYDDPGPVTIREPEQKQARRKVIDDENAPAAMAEVFWRTVPAGHKDEVALDLLSEILGGGNSSRLYRELVAEKQTAVEAGSWVFNLEHDGLFGCSTTEAPGADTEELITAIKRNVKELADNGVTDEELEKAKNRALRSIVTQNLTIQRKTRVLGNAAMIMGDIEKANTILDDIKAVIAGDLQRVAKTYLTENKSVTIIIKENKDPAAGAKKTDESSAVTAEVEKVAPAAGRGNVNRPDDWAKEVPFGEMIAYKSTPKYTVDKLDNGLKVMVVPNHEVPFVSVQLGLLSGAWTESRPGMASMTMKMLTKGTKEYNEAQLAEELARYAISLSGRAGMDTVSVYASCLKEQVSRAMELMSQVVLEPTFDDSEFAKLQKQVVTRLKIEEESPRYLANKEFRKVLYGKHPYARTVTGERTDVEALNTGNLKLWWSKASRPDRSTLIFAGDITRQEALKLAKKNLGGWKIGLIEMGLVLPDIAEIKEKHIYIVDRPGAAQSEIRVGQIGITRHQLPDYFISRVVSEYFGGSFHSRLNDTLRVKKGLTYGARGSFSARNFAGEFRASTFTKTASTPEAVQVIFDVIKQLQDVEPDDRELDNTKSYIAGSFVRNRETPQSVARDLWLIESQRLGSDYLDNLLASVAGTTKQQCVEFVKNNINPDKMVVVIAGDASKIKDELSKIAPVTVIGQ